MGGEEMSLPKMSRIYNRNEGKRRAETSVLFDHTNAATLRKIREKINRHAVRAGLISIQVAPSIESEDGILVDLEWIHKKVLLGIAVTNIVAYAGRRTQEMILGNSCAF